MIHPYVMQMLAQQRQRERAQSTAAQPQPTDTPASPVEAEISIRYARPGDLSSLARLSELESKALTEGPWLAAETRGVLAAALSLADGTVLADPFRPTANLLSLLELRAAQLEGRKGRFRIRLRRSLRPAFSR